MSLRGTQRWFLDEVRRTTAIPRPRRPARRAAAEEVVLPSATLTARERMSIYGNMYAARLEECLADDYRVVHVLLGCDGFSRVCRRYITRHPPTSWTLNELGAKFPAFLRRVPRLRRAALVRDVARIERAMSEAFDAEQTPPLTPAGVARVPAAAWATARLVPSASLRLLALGTRANAVVTSVREDRGIPAGTAAGRSWVAVYRKEYRVWRLDLTEPMHAALAALVRGKPLGAAVAAAQRVFDGDPAALPESVRRWFALWIDEGLFAAVRRR